jgi:hypothetical protein
MGQGGRNLLPPDIRHDHLAPQLPCCCCLQSGIRSDYRSGGFASTRIVLGLVPERMAAFPPIAEVSLAPGRAEPAPVIHHAPGENLEHVDVALIDSAA